MVRTVERIEQELAALDRSVAALAQEFQDAYRQYLDALGQAVRQQLILAGYHLCTQGYPDRFLKLSLAQRQQLQQSLRQLAKQTHEQLLEHLLVQPSDPTPTTVLFTATGTSVTQEPGSSIAEPLEVNDIPPPDLQPEAQSDSTASEDSSQDQVVEEEVAALPPIEELGSFQISLTADRSLQASEQEPESDQPLHPKQLAYWQERLEENIIEELQDLSHAANRMLQQLKVLPNRLPEPVLEVAAKADLASEATASPPNLLNLLIESETEEQQETTMTQFIAIRLRLSEIEFSHSAATIHRSKIRELSAQLNKLGREYQKKLKERSIAQAEAAWRSSWYED